MICGNVQGSEVKVGNIEYRAGQLTWEVNADGKWIEVDEHTSYFLDALYESKQENKVMRAYVDKHAAYGLESAIECLEKIGVQIPV